MSMDISRTLEPDSEQLDACELVDGPRVFTVERVTKGNAEQPVNVHLADFPRPWRPGKSMRRVLAKCWGKDASAWVGKRVELFCDDSVIFGGQAVGGTRISRISHIDGPQRVPLLVSRGKSAIYTVTSLPDVAPSSPVVSDETLGELMAMFTRKGIPEGARLPGANSITGGSATDLECITEAEARKVLTALASRPDVEPTA